MFGKNSFLWTWFFRIIDNSLIKKSLFVLRFLHWKCLEINSNIFCFEFSKYCYLWQQLIWRQPPLPLPGIFYLHPSGSHAMRSFRTSGCFPEWCEFKSHIETAPSPYLLGLIEVTLRIEGIGVSFCQVLSIFHSTRSIIPSLHLLHPNNFLGFTC